MLLCRPEATLRPFNTIDGPKSILSHEVAVVAHICLNVFACLAGTASGGIYFFSNAIFNLVNRAPYPFRLPISAEWCYVSIQGGKYHWSVSRRTEWLFLMLSWDEYKNIV